MITTRTEETAELVPLGDAIKDRQKIGVQCLDNGAYLRPTKDGKVFADETSSTLTTTAGASSASPSSSASTTTSSATIHQHFVLRRKDDFRFFLVAADSGKYLFKKKTLGFSQGEHIFVGNTAKKRHLVIDKQSSEVVVATCEAAVPPPSSPRFRLVF